MMQFARDALELKTLELSDVTQNEFREHLERYGMTAAGFARATRWNRSCVSRCLNGGAPIPGPVLAFMDLLDNIPAALEHARQRSVVVRKSPVSGSSDRPA